MHRISYLRFPFFVIIAITISFCCNENDKLSIEKAASVFDIKQAEASISQSNQHFIKSFKAGDSISVASCYTSDAKVLAANSPSIKGSENIIHFISESMKKGIKNLDLSTASVWGDSSIVAEEGTYELSNNSRKTIDKGKYIVLWKQEAGNWKMFRDIWTTDLTYTLNEKEPAVNK